MTRAILLHTALALLLFAGGYSLARSTRSDGGDQSFRAKGRRVVSALVATDGKAGAMLAQVARDESLGWRGKLKRFFALLDVAKSGDLPGLLRAADRDLPWNLGGRELKAAILRRWAEEDMEGLLRAVVAGDLPRGTDLDWAALRAIAETDLTQAMKMFSALPAADGMSWRSKLAMASVGRWQLESGADPKQCLSLLLHTPDPDRMMSPKAWRSLVRQVARRDPEALLAAVGEIAPGLLSDEVFVETYQALAQHDLRGALRILMNESRQGKLPQGMAEGIVGVWSRRDSAAALAWMEKQPASASGDRMMADLLQQHAKTNPRETAEKCVQLRSPELRIDVARAVAWAWVESDPAAVEIWAREGLEGEALDLVLRIIGRAKEGGR